MNHVLLNHLEEMINAVTPILYLCPDNSLGGVHMFPGTWYMEYRASRGTQAYLLARAEKSKGQHNMQVQPLREAIHA